VDSARVACDGITIGFVNVQYPVIAGLLMLHLDSHGNSGPEAFAASALTVLTARFFFGGSPNRINPAITFFTGLVLMAVGLTVLALRPRVSSRLRLDSLSRGRQWLRRRYKRFWSMSWARLWAL